MTVIFSIFSRFSGHSQFIIWQYKIDFNYSQIEKNMHINPLKKKVFVKQIDIFLNSKFIVPDSLSVPELRNFAIKMSKIFLGYNRRKV